MLFFLTYFALSLEECYVNYSRDGCPRCTPRSYETCGFCVDKGICVPGTNLGPNRNECTLDLYIFPKTTCTQEMCQIAKEQSYCKTPCQWISSYSQCILKRDLSFPSDEEVKNMNHSSVSLKIIIACVVVFLLAGIAFFVYGCLTHKRTSKYAELPDLDNNIPLDQL